MDLGTSPLVIINAQVFILVDRINRMTPLTFIMLNAIDVSWETVDDKAFRVSSVQVFHSAKVLSCCAKYLNVSENCVLQS